MKSETSYKAFFLKGQGKIATEILFSHESVITALAKIPQGHRTVQIAHGALHQVDSSVDEALQCIFACGRVDVDGVDTGIDVDVDVEVEVDDDIKVVD